MPRPRKNENLLTLSEVATLFKRTTVTIYLWREKLGFPFVRFPSKSRDIILYRKSDIKKWAKKHGKEISEPVV